MDSNRDALHYRRDFFYINSSPCVDKVKSLQDLCRSKIISSVTLDRAQIIRKLPLPSLIKDYLCSFGIPKDFDLDGFYIDYHCNFPNHVHHKVHQIHPGKCLIDGSKVLIKSQCMSVTCRTCEAVGKCSMDNIEDREIWLHLKHSNLMKCHMAMEDNQTQRVCLVFEFPGITLQDFIFRMFLAKKTIPEMISWQVLQKLSTVLIYLENNGLLPWELCHPQNVVITSKGEIKLENLLLYLPTHAGSRYQTNTGKRFSPEQAAGESVSSKTLVWGLGNILYELSSRIPNQLSSNGNAQFPQMNYHQAVASTRELSKVMCDCLKSNPSSRPSLLSLEQLAMEQIESQDNYHVSGTSLLDLMKSLDRLPLSGGFLKT